jgi:hypothetical protein
MLASEKKKVLQSASCLNTSKGKGEKYLVILVSISPTFYEQLLHQNPFTKKLQTQIVST